MNRGSGVSIGGVKIVRVHLSDYEVEGGQSFSQGLASSGMNMTMFYLKHLQQIQNIRGCPMKLVDGY